MPDLPLAVDLILLLLVAFLGGVAAAYLRQPLVTGYLLAGLLFGPFVFGLVKNNSEITFLAEIGVALLMFTMGVEFNLANLGGLGRTAVVGTIIQIICSVVFALPLALLLHWAFIQAFFFGSLLALSSTAIVVKLLTDRGKLDTVAGQLSSAWLLSQDLAVLPLIILLPVLSGQSTGFLSLSGAILKSVLFLVATFYLGGKAIPFVLKKVSIYGREVLLLSVVLLILGIAGLSVWFGLSFAMGAFLAGLIVSETELSDEALAQVKSMRDLFLILFFVSIGMLIDPRFIFSNIPVILLVIVILYISRVVPVFGWITSFGYHAKVAFLVSIYLLQVGEFGFVLGKMGLDLKIITLYQYNLILAVALVSLLATPFFIKGDDYLYIRFKKVLGAVPFIGKRLLTGRQLSEPIPADKIKDHVILLGFGRVGRYISQALRHVGIAHVVVDVDPKALKDAREKGIEAIYGDGSELEILEKAGIKDARALVITHPDQASALLTVSRSKKINPELKILARAHRDLDVENLKDLEIEKVVQPEFEASVSLMHTLLDKLGVDEDTVTSFTDHIRRQPFGR